MMATHTPESRRSRQSGATLLITMVMVILLTLLVVSAIRISNVNLRITGNFQWQKMQELLTDSAIEQVISSSNSFDDSDVQAGTATNKIICSDGSVVATSCPTAYPAIGTVSSPVCTASKPATGYGKKINTLSPDDNSWVINAVATDSFSGAKVSVYRGVTVRMLAGSCPE